MRLRILALGDLSDLGDSDSLLQLKQGGAIASEDVDRVLLPQVDQSHSP